MNAKDSIEYQFRVAIDSGDVEAAQAILGEMPDVAQKLSSKRVWLLKDAAKKSTPEMIRWLVHHLGEDVNKHDSNEYTALNFAVLFGKLENAETLLDLGACPNFGCPLFSILSEDVSDPIAMASLLIEKGADINQLVIEEGMPQRNVLTEAIVHDNEALVAFLWSRGARLPDELSQT